MVLQLPSLDHIVLPVENLAQSRARLAALGFTVAPDGHHPFGTSNCCVYFSNGTFIEPLAIADVDQTNLAIEEHNLFVGRDRIFREQAGKEGMSAVVLMTADANADHARFVEAGISAGPMLEFSRPFVDAQGKSDEAVFRLAFAAEPDSPGCYFFTCQRVRAPDVDRAALQAHPNGVLRPGRVLWRADARRNAGRFWDSFLGVPAREEDDERMIFGVANSMFWVGHDTALHERFGIEPAGSSGGMVGRAIVFECSDRQIVAQMLDDRRVEYHVRGQSIIVPPAPGQGATFIFEEI